MLLSCLFFQTASKADDEELKTKQFHVADAIEKTPVSKIKLFFYSLDPNAKTEFDGKLQEDTRKYFCGFKVLGRFEVVSFQEKTNLMESFTEGVREGSRGMYCFEPRHGIRMVDGTTTNDFVICFECHQVEAYGSFPESDFAMSSSPASTFNELLDKHKIKRAE